MKKLIIALWLLVFLGLPAGVLASEVKTIALPPLADAYADQVRPGSKTGDYPTLYVAYNTKDRQVLHTLLNFDLSRIPSSATISVAKLRLYQQAAFADSGVSATNFSLYILNKPWVEKELTWNNRPTFFVPDSCKTQGYAVDKNRGFKELDMKCLVNHWRKGNNPYYGFLLTTPSNQNWTSMFYSRENAEKNPQLVITYTIAGITPPPPSPSPATPAAESEPGFAPVDSPVSTPAPAATLAATPVPSAPQPPAPGVANQLEAELSQILTAKNIKIAAIGLFTLLAIKVLLLH